MTTSYPIRISANTSLDAPRLMETDSASIGGFQSIAVSPASTINQEPPVDQQWPTMAYGASLEPAPRDGQDAGRRTVSRGFAGKDRDRATMMAYLAIGLAFIVMGFLGQGVVGFCVGIVFLSLGLQSLHQQSNQGGRRSGRT